MKEFLALTAIAALGLLALAAVLQALRLLLALREAGKLDAAYDAERTRLQDERDRLLNHLREVHFDHQTGKLDVHDFSQLSDRYANEAAVVLDALERLDARHAGLAEART